MALTPEQVLNKHFQTTQFRKGYDERDVDDFLDEIVAETVSYTHLDVYKRQAQTPSASSEGGHPAYQEVRPAPATPPTMPSVPRVPTDDADDLDVPDFLK